MENHGSDIRGVAFLALVVVRSGASRSELGGTMSISTAGPTYGVRLHSLRVTSNVTRTAVDPLLILVPLRARKPIK